MLFAADYGTNLPEVKGQSVNCGPEDIGEPYWRYSGQTRDVMGKIALESPWEIKIPGSLTDLATPSIELTWNVKWTEVELVLDQPQVYVCRGDDLSEVYVNWGPSRILDSKWQIVEGSLILDPHSYEKKIILDFPNSF